MFHVQTLGCTARPSVRHYGRILATGQILFLCQNCIQTYRHTYRHTDIFFIPTQWYHCIHHYNNIIIKIHLNIFKAKFNNCENWLYSCCLMNAQEDNLLFQRICCHAQSVLSRMWHLVPLCLAESIRLDYCMPIPSLILGCSFFVLFVKLLCYLVMLLSWVFFVVLFHNISDISILIRNLLFIMYIL